MNREKHWMNMGPNIEGESYLIVCINVDPKEDYKSVALVNDEKDVGIILHAPEMHKLLHELVMLNLLKKQIGETDYYNQRIEESFFKAEQLLCDFVEEAAPNESGIEFE